MKKARIKLILLCAISLSVLLTACTKKDELLNEYTAAHTPLTEIHFATTTIHPTSTPFLNPPSSEIHDREIEAENAEKRKRKGEIKIDNLENIGVKGELLKVVMALLESVKNKNEEAKLKLHYDSGFITYDAVEEPFILAFTRIELDNTELEHMMEGYNFFSEAAIVKITAIKLDRQLEEVESTGKYIFVKVDDIWKVFRSY